MSYKCTGCGETHPSDPALTVQDALICDDGEWSQIDEARLCADCSPTNHD